MKALMLDFAMDVILHNLPDKKSSDSLETKKVVMFKIRHSDFNYKRGAAVFARIVKHL